MSSSTRYITSMGELSRKDNSLIFRNDKGHKYIPIEGIKVIYCLNEVSINSKLLDFLSRNKIMIHFFNYYGYYSGTFYPKEAYISGKVTIAQVKKFEENRLEIAKAIVKGIGINIYEVLYHYYKHGYKELKPLLNWLNKETGAILDKLDNIKQILYLEGSIWKRFYETFPVYLPEDFLFNKKVKRPPDNPMNALISFGNSMLYTKVISQLYKTHLNQGISYLHEPFESRFSLSLDISEVFKPVIVYKTIFELVNNKKVQVNKHFEKQLNYCLLNENGRKIFIENFEKRLESSFEHPKLKRKITYNTAIKLEGYKLIKNLVENEKFVPFNLKEKI
ncbi:MAG: type I-B CRISPR-associated endonuclease Cas1b [Leptotrichiaceae bacterium]|nr:type I-B CRISPR-associated endonuclease Cas1b [Leptotrichiaceae bacterium]